MNCVRSPYGVVSTTAAAERGRGFRAIRFVSGRNPGPSNAQLPSKRKPNGYRCQLCGAPATRMTVDGVPLCEGDFWHLVEHARDGSDSAQGRAA